MSFNLLGPIESADRLIVVDTAELNNPPGSVKVFEGIEMDASRLEINPFAVYEQLPFPLNCIQNILYHLWLSLSDCIRIQ